MTQDTRKLLTSSSGPSWSGPSCRRAGWSLGRLASWILGWKDIFGHWRMELSCSLYPKVNPRFTKTVSRRVAVRLLYKFPNFKIYHCRNRLISSMKRRFSQDSMLSSKVFEVLAWLNTLPLMRYCSGTSSSSGGYLLTLESVLRVFIFLNWCRPYLDLLYISGADLLLAHEYKNREYTLELFTLFKSNKVILSESSIQHQFQHSKITNKTTKFTQLNCIYCFQDQRT
ncbi:Hypothetical_protein [Hexamita inflata]|uniref:Hypothetical_protein n=1 Tax=Hexamita inflata TaxID=28002 RepID=A0ABP1HKW0_9EUKA